MAQVKKYNTGGYLKIGNKTYTYDQITEYINQANFSPAERSAIADVVASINKDIIDDTQGRFNVRYLDRNANTLSGYDIESDLLGYYGGNERKLERNMNGRSERWANRQARRNSQHHIMNSAISKLGAIEDYYDQKTKDEAEKAKDKNILYKIEDPDGFYIDGVFEKNSPKNIENLNRIGRIFDAMYATDRSGYNLVKWGNDDNLGGLVEWAKQNPNYKDGLITRLQTNTLNNLDKEILGLMGATFDGDSTKSIYLPGATDSSKKWADNLGITFKKNSDGRWTITDAAGSRSKGIYLTNGDPVFNGTEFADTYIINGNLYTPDEIGKGTIPEIVTNLGAFLGTASNGWDALSDYYEALNNHGISYYGKSDDRLYGGFGYVDLSQVPNRAGSILSSDDFMRLFESNPYIMDLTNQYSINDPKGIGQIYVIPDKGTDNLGRPKLKYVYARPNQNGWDIFSSDSISNLSIPDVTLTDLQKPYVGDTEFKLRQSKMINGKAYVPIFDNGRFQVYYANGNYFIPFGESGDSVLPVRDVPRMLNYIEALKDADPNNDPTVRDWSTLIEKHGGKIKSPVRFQFGGNVSKARTNVKIEQAPTEVVSELSKTHTLNTSTIKKRGLNAYEDVKKSFEQDITEAEQQQLRGAVYDLLGVAASFIPAIGNVLGAGLGIAGTWQTFKGDVNKDGLDWGDIGSGLFNLAMDAGSLLPFVGKAVKATKAFRGIKAASKVLMKLFVLNGIRTGFNAVQKIANGEDINTDEAIDILRGLTSTGIGAKMVKNQLGDAKLSKQLEDEVLKTKNANLKGSPEIEIRGKKIKADLDKIQGRTKAKVEKYLKEKVANALGSDFKKGVDDVELSKKFGIEYSKEDLKWSNVGRRKKLAKFVPEEELEGNSLFTHFISPNLRTKYIGGYYTPLAIGGDSGWHLPTKYNKGYLHLITPEQVSSAFQNAKSWKGFSSNENGSTLVDEAILRKTWEAPKSFSFDLGDPRVFTDKGGRWYLGRNVASSSEVEPSTTTTKVVPQQDVKIIPEVTITPQTTPQIAAPTIGDLRTHRARVRHNVPVQPVIESPQSYSTSIYDLSTLGNYAKSGASYKDLHAYASWILQSNGIVPTPTKVASLLETAVLARQLPLDYLKEGGTVRKKIKKAQDPSDTSLMASDENGNLNDKINASGTMSFKPVPFGNFVGNYNPKIPWKTIAPVLPDFGRASGQFTGNLIGLNRQKNNFDKNIETVLKTDYVIPTEYYQSYTPSGILESAELESEQLNNLNYYNPTSDPITNREIMSSANSQNRLEMSKAQLAESQYRNDQKTKFISNLNDNAKTRAAMSNQNTQKDLHATASKTQNDNAFIASLAQQFNGYIGDIANLIKTPAAKKKQLDLMTYQWKYQDWYRNANAYYKKQKEDGKTKASSFDEFLNEPSNKTLLDEYRSYQLAPLTMKKGGKIRPINEMVELENNKHRLKEISRLSKQAYELLKTALK